MDALVQFFTTVAMVMATTAMSQMGVINERSNARDQKSGAERSIKRTPQPQASIVLRLPR